MSRLLAITSIRIWVKEYFSMNNTYAAIALQARKPPRRSQNLMLWRVHKLTCVAIALVIALPVAMAQNPKPIDVVSSPFHIPKPGIYMFRTPGTFIVIFDDKDVSAIVISGCGGGGGGGGQNEDSATAGENSYFDVNLSGLEPLAEYPGAPRGEKLYGGGTDWGGRIDGRFNHGGDGNRNGADSVDPDTGKKLFDGGNGYVDAGDPNAGHPYDGGGGGASSFGKGGDGGSYNYTGGQAGANGAGGGGSYAFNRSTAGFGGGAGCKATTQTLSIDRKLQYRVVVGKGGSGAGGNALSGGQGGKGGDGGPGEVKILY
jgi:hypothetical protein